MYDVIISSRVRLARNLADLPFPNRTTPQQKNEICEKVRDIFSQNKSFGVAHYGEMEQCDRLSLVEKHLISRDFASSADGRELITAENISIMINEEDTFRIQSIVPGFDLDKAFDSASLADDFIDEHFNYAFDEQLGYLTACPTNLGCAMRASVMLHLPALEKLSEIGPLANSLAQLGFTLRGMYGEGSKARGSIYQLSNSLSEGKSEQEILESLKKIAVRITDSETKARKLLFDSAPLKMEDQVVRSCAIARNAKLISEDEYFTLLSNIAIGITCGVVRDLTTDALYSTLTQLPDATIMSVHRDATDDTARCMYRAEGFKKIFR